MYNSHFFLGYFLLLLNKHTEIMKPTTNLLIALVCFLIIFYHYIFHFEIISHPYMKMLIFVLFFIGGWNAGLGIGKIVNEK